MAKNEGQTTQSQNLRLSPDASEKDDDGVVKDHEAIAESTGADGIVEITVSTESSCTQRSLDEDKTDLSGTSPQRETTLEIPTVRYIYARKDPLTPRRYRPIAPKGTEDDQNNGDDEESMWFWQKVLELRQVMLDNKKGPGYHFTRNEISKFNELGRKQIQGLPRQIQYISKVAYLDQESWNVASAIVERMKSGTLHGKGYPTSNTFRFLMNCNTPEQKREKLLEYLQYNSIGAFSKCKKRSIAVKVRCKKDNEEIAASKMVKILEERVELLEQQISKLRLEKEQLNKEIQGKDIEIYQLHGELRTYSNRVADLELTMARQELKIRETEKDKNLRVKELTQNIKEWKDLYYQSMREEETNTDLLESSVESPDDNAMSEYDPTDSAVDEENTDIQESDEESTEEVSDEDHVEPTLSFTSHSSRKAKLNPGDFVAFTSFKNSFQLGRVTETKGNVSKDEVAVEYGQARPNNEYDFRKKKRDTVKREHIFKWGADINAKYVRSATWRVDRTLLEKEHKAAVKMLRGKKEKREEDTVK